MKLQKKIGEEKKNLIWRNLLSVPFQQDTSMDNINTVV